MNRRSILSTLCTGALALLAPVAAWAGGRRGGAVAPRCLKCGQTRFQNFQAVHSGQEMLWRCRCGEWNRQVTSLQTRNSGRSASITLADQQFSGIVREGMKARLEAQELRALLAEARERLEIADNRWFVNEMPCTGAKMNNADLLARINDALK